MRDLEFQEHEECFFRGHSQSTHSLLPGLFRGVEIKGKKIPDDLWAIESDLFYEFRAKARELHKDHISDWHILFYMQHHGVRTRLLDWSESLAVAVYFALLNYDSLKSHPCVWILNPYKLNEEYHDSRDLFDPQLLGFYEGYETEGDSYAEMILYNDPEDVFPWDAPLGLYPVRRADRLTTQSGYFTIHGNDCRPFEKSIPALKNICRKIDIPKDAIMSAQLFLKHAGVNQFTLFPDMDGLAKYLNLKYYLALKNPVAI